MGKGDEIKVLLVEDDGDNPVLTQEMLAEERSVGEAFYVTKARRLGEGIRYLKENRFDVVLLDLDLPDGNGLENVTRVCSVMSDLPVVLLIGSLEEERTALEGVKQGAQDYLFKDGLNRSALVRTIRSAIERNKLEKKLREAQSMLAQAEKMVIIGQLAAGVAHEVKNPLGIILQGVDFLGKKLSPEGGQNLEVLKMIESAVERADKIIQGLLQFARTAPLRMVPTEMGGLIDSSLELVEKQLAFGKIQIVRNFQKPLCALVDRNQLQQVFINIIMNAVQSMPGGGELSLKTCADGTGEKELLVCEIGDTGVGISKENLAKVFDPFFTTKPAGEGTGLGLGISKSILIAHGGLLDIKSEEGKGTVVGITLPLTDCNRGCRD